MSELVIPVQRRQADDLIAWAEAAREVHIVAKMITTTEFVPKALRGRPDAISAAILTGREIGLSPMVSLAAIDIIEGKPGLNAMALRGLVQSHGHAIEVVEANDTRATVRGRRRDSGHWETSEWTMDRARKAGLAEKPTWKRNTRQMLIARATAEVCRLIAADSIIGLAYSQEELADGGDVQEVDEVETEPAPKLRVMKRAAPKAEPVPEPDPPFEPEPQREISAQAEPEPEPAVVPAPRTGTEVDGWPVVTELGNGAIPGDPGGVDDPDAEKIATQQQRNVLHHALGQLGKIQDKLKFVRETTGRYTIKTTADMNREEAKRCIEKAQQLIREQEAEKEAGS
jgi:hypothetical protein